LTLNGCHTALVTPFNNGKVCYSTFGDLIEEQLAAGVDGIVPAGTTGESPTLTVKEHKRVIESAVKVVNGRCKVIAGTGGNSTSEALELTQFARDAGADATLQVTPYYNKPTQEGLYRHFAAVADDGGLPVVLYNIPGRTCINIDLETIKRLDRNVNIVAIKEASGNIERVSWILENCNLTVLSGDDAATLPFIAVGAQGVISVASNLIPAEIARLTHSMMNDNVVEARTLHFRFSKLFDALFIETNPIPIKAAMAIKGMIKEEYRLPLCPMSDVNRKKLIEAMSKTAILG
jgi:4-hydroxy-tetrahydrodipicolinate synthase